MKVRRYQNTDKNCMDRCRFRAENCWMHPDGTWDCSTKIEECPDHCRLS